jgi:hypothetical protein
MTLYKLTNQDMTTHGGFRYALGVTAHATGAGEPELCTNTVLHAYTSPALAVLMNPIHANIDNPRLFRAEGDVVVSDHVKVGVRSLTLVEELTVPVIETAARVRWAMSLAWPVASASWLVWAAAWLSGEDRSRASARAAARDASATDAASAADYAARAADGCASGVNRYAAVRAAYAAYANAAESLDLSALDETDAETLARLTGRA